MPPSIFIHSKRREEMEQEQAQQFVEEVYDDVVDEVFWMGGLKQMHGLHPLSNFHLICLQTLTHSRTHNLPMERGLTYAPYAANGMPRPRMTKILSTWTTTNSKRSKDYPASSD